MIIDDKYIIKNKANIYKFPMRVKLIVYYYINLNINSLYYMFNGYSSLISIDLSNFNIQNAK